MKPETYTNIREIIVAPVPETERWGVYRAFTDGRILLWDTSIIRKSAIEKGAKESKKFGVEIAVEPKHGRWGNQ